MKIEFTADLIKIRGPKVDGGWSVTFEVGEYEVSKILELPFLNGAPINVAVDVVKPDCDKRSPA